MRFIDLAMALTPLTTIWALPSQPQVSSDKAAAEIEDSRAAASDGGLRNFWTGAGLGILASGPVAWFGGVRWGRQNPRRGGGHPRGTQQTVSRPGLGDTHAKRAEPEAAALQEWISFKQKSPPPKTTDPRVARRSIAEMLDRFERNIDSGPELKEFFWWRSWRHYCHMSVVSCFVR